MIVQRATDPTELERLRLRSLEDAPHAFSSSPADERARAPAFFEAIATGKADGVAFIARAGDEPVGLVGIREVEAGVASVWGTWVAPECRRQGCALALMRAAVGWARAHGAREVRLAVATAPEAQPAGALYRRLGFLPTGEVQDMGATDAPAAVMRLSL